MDAQRRNPTPCADCGDCCDILETLRLSCSQVPKNKPLALQFNNACNPSLVEINTQAQNQLTFTLRIIPQRDGTRQAWFPAVADFPVPDAQMGNLVNPAFVAQILNLKTQGTTGYYKTITAADIAFPVITPTAGGDYQFFEITGFHATPNATFQVQIQERNAPTVFIGVLFGQGNDQYRRLPLRAEIVKSGADLIQFGLATITEPNPFAPRVLEIASFYAPIIEKPFYGVTSDTNQILAVGTDADGTIAFPVVNFLDFDITIIG